VASVAFVLALFPGLARFDARDGAHSLNAAAA